MTTHTLELTDAYSTGITLGRKVRSGAITAADALERIAQDVSHDPNADATKLALDGFRDGNRNPNWRT